MKCKGLVTSEPVIKCPYAISELDRAQTRKPRPSKVKGDDEGHAKPCGQAVLGLEPNYPTKSKL